MMQEMTGLTRDLVVVVEVERVAWVELDILTGVATVRKMVDVLGVMGVLVEAVFGLLVGATVVTAEDEELIAALAAWKLAARRLSRIFLLALFLFFGGVWWCG